MSFLRETRFNVVAFGIVSMLLLVLLAPVALADDGPVVVETPEQLMGAMSEDNTNDHIVIDSCSFGCGPGGEYFVNQRLFAYGLVESAGGATVIIVDDGGVPSPTGLEISAGVIELGPGAELRGVTVDARNSADHQSALHVRGAEGTQFHSVTIQDVVAYGLGGGRGGAITVFSRQADQRVEVAISDSELNGNGRNTIRVINGGEGTQIDLTFSNLDVDTPDRGSGLFILAGFNHGGGASNTVTTVDSTDNNWIGGGCNTTGWNVRFLDGFFGRNDPSLFDEDQSGTSNGLIEIESDNDYFEGFARSISSNVTIGNRPSPSGVDGAVEGNTIDLEFEDLTSVVDPTCEGSDVELSEPVVLDVDGGRGSSPPPIRDNTISLELEGALSRGVALLEGSCPETWTCDVTDNEFKVDVDDENDDEDEDDD